MHRWILYLISHLKLLQTFLVHVAIESEMVLQRLTSPTPLYTDLGWGK